FHAIKETQHRIRADGDTQVLRQPGTCLTAQEDTDSGQQAFQPFGPTRMGTDQSRETFCKHAAATGRILAPKPSHHQLNVHRPAVRGQVHQEPGIAAVPAAGDAAARRTWGVGLCTLDGDGNVCWRKLLMPNDKPLLRRNPHIPRSSTRSNRKGVRGFHEDSSSRQLDCTKIAGESVYHRRSHSMRLLTLLSHAQWLPKAHFRRSAPTNLGQTLALLNAWHWQPFLRSAHR